MSYHSNSISIAVRHFRVARFRRTYSPFNQCCHLDSKSIFNLSFGMDFQQQTCGLIENNLRHSATRSNSSLASSAAYLQRRLLTGGRLTIRPSLHAPPSSYNLLGSLLDKAGTAVLSAMCSKGASLPAHLRADCTVNSVQKSLHNSAITINNSPGRWRT